MFFYMFTYDHFNFTYSTSLKTSWDFLCRQFCSFQIRNKNTFIDYSSVLLLLLMYSLEFPVWFWKGQVRINTWLFPELKEAFSLVKCILYRFFKKYLFNIPTIASPSLSPPTQFPTFPLLPPLSQSLLHIRRGRPPMGISKAWHIKLPLVQAPPPVFRMGKAIQHEE